MATASKALKNNNNIETSLAEVIAEVIESIAEVIESEDLKNEKMKREMKRKFVDFLKRKRDGDDEDGSEKNSGPTYTLK